MMKKLRVTVDGKTYDVSVEVLGTEGAAPVASAPRPMSPAQAVAPAPAPIAPKQVSPGAGQVLSPLAGKVVSIDCKVGDTINSGTKVITLEAMKMNTEVIAYVNGTVKSISVNAGDSVEEGQLLVTLG